MAKKSTASDSKPTHEEIAQRARAIYEQSGRIPGRDMDNWLQAEAQLLAARHHSATNSSPVRAVARPMNAQAVVRR